MDAYLPSAWPVFFAGFLFFGAVVCAVSPVRFVGSYLRTRVKPVAFNLRLFLTSVLVATLLAGGITLVLGVGGGVDWVPFSFILALVVASTNAWVLTVEVLR